MMLFVRRKSTKKQGKVKNATPNEYDGIKFRSKLETYTYKKLKEAKIKADYERVIKLVQLAFDLLKINGTKQYVSNKNVDFRD